MYDRKDFQWRYAPSKQSASGVLLAYIDGEELHPLRDKKQMMLTALKAHYLPLAYLALGKSRLEVERVGWDSVLALLEQVDFLCSVLGLERKSSGYFEPIRFNEVRDNRNSEQSKQKREVNQSNGSTEASNQPERLNKEGLSKFRLTYSSDNKLSALRESKTPEK